MPAIDTKRGKPAKKKVRVRKPPASPDQADRTRQQTQQGRKSASQDRYRDAHEQQLLSEAHSVRIRARDARTQERGTSASGDRPQGRAKAMRSPAVQQGVKKARLRVKATQGRGAGIRQVKAELEGRGALGGIAGKAGDIASSVIGKTGIPIPGFQATEPPAIKKLRVKVSGNSRFARKQAAADTVSTELLQNAAKDAINFPAAAVPSVYVPVAGVVEAAKGHPERLKKFVEDTKQNDPVYNTAAAAFEAARGNSEAAKSHLAKAEKAATEHPLNTGLEVYGLGKGADNLAGRTARTGVAGRKVRAATATRGADRTIPGTNISEPRNYPKGLIQGQVKRHQERTAREETRALRDHADAIRETDPDTARELDAKANRRDPDRVKPHEVRRRVDETVAANEDLRRIGRADVSKQVDKALKGVPKDQRPLVALVAQRIARADVGDLKAYVSELEKEFKGLTSAADKRANVDLRARIQRALKNPERLPEVERAAQRYAEVVGPLQSKLVERGLLDADQAERAAVIPYAVRRMGARHTAEHREAAAADAKERRDNTRARVERLEGERSRLVGAQSVTRGRDAAHEPQVAYKVGDRRFDRSEDAKAYADSNGGEVTRVALTAREAKRHGEAARVERALRKARADLRQHEAEYRDAHARRNDAELVDAEGRPLSTEAIRAHMEGAGESPAAFITQARSNRGPRNFNIRSERAQAISNARRTGSATKRGTFDIHPDVLREQAARAQGLADATDGFRRFVKENGVRGSSGKLKVVQTHRQARAVVDELNAIPGGHEFRAIQVNPFGARREQLQGLIDDVGVDSQMARMHGADSPLVQSMMDALDSTGGEGPWAIIPAEAASQLNAHLRSMGTGAGGKTAQVLNNAFRKTVLSTSPTWLAGNVIEGAFRTALARGGPRSYVTGRRTLKRLEEIDPQAAREASVRTVGGAHFTSAEKQAIHNAAEQYAGTRLEGTAEALGKFWRTPGPKQAAALWQAWTHLVFHQINGPIERVFQTTALGAELRRSPLMSGRTRKLSAAAIDDAARGLRHTNAQVEFGRAVDRIIGRYGKLGPDERKIITTYTPFVRWSLNAVRFIVDVLPRDHPVVTALIASMETTTDEWRREHGLAKMVDGAAPDWLQGSIPTPGGGHLRVSRYLPFSIGSDPLGTFSDQVLPQARSVLLAMEGKDWKGNTLRTADGSEPDDAQRALAAAHALATSAVPVLGQSERVAQDGPGALNPFRPVKPKQKVRRPKSLGRAEGVYADPAAAGGAYSDPNVK